MAFFGRVASARACYLLLTCGLACGGADLGWYIDSIDCYILPVLNTVSLLLANNTYLKSQSNIHIYEGVVQQTIPRPLDLPPPTRERGSN